MQVDAQGLDATIIATARRRLSQVRRFQLEVIADDCDTLYEGQPHCSEVLSLASRLGFTPATPVRCAPPATVRNKRWRTTAWGCELEIVFLARGVPMLPPLWRFHQLSQAGCAATYHSIAHAPNGSVIMHDVGQWSAKDADGRIRPLDKYSDERFPGGELYVCTPIS